MATAIPKITDEFKGLDKAGWYGAAFFMTVGAFQSTCKSSGLLHQRGIPILTHFFQGARRTSTFRSRPPSSPPSSSSSSAPSSAAPPPTPRPSSPAEPSLVSVLRASAPVPTPSLPFPRRPRSALLSRASSELPMVSPASSDRCWEERSPTTSAGDGVSTSTCPSAVSRQPSSSSSSRPLEMRSPSRRLCLRRSGRWIPSV